MQPNFKAVLIVFSSYFLVEGIFIQVFLDKALVFFIMKSLLALWTTFFLIHEIKVRKVFQLNNDLHADLEN